jgi:hypothetical protein
LPAGAFTSDDRNRGAQVDPFKLDTTDRIDQTSDQTQWLAS